MSELKKTALYSEHVRLGGKIVPFAGYEMPVQFTSIRQEHEAVRNHVGVFDVSHMGEILFTGKDALKNVDHLVSNHIAKIKPFRVVYSGLLYPNGTFVDDVLVYRIKDDEFLFCVNASNVDKDFAWMKQNLSGDLTCENVSDRYTQIAIQGPDAGKVLQPLTRTDLSTIAYYRFQMGQVAGIDALISRTGYTGEYGFELYFSPEHAIKIFQAVMESGAPFGITPAGLGCRDTLRLEAGMALYGNDIDDQHTALEANLGWVVKLEKDDFIGKKALEEQQQAGLKRHLVGFEMIDRGIPRHGYSILSNSVPIGEVTSGTMSITLNKAIGMGYVASGFESPGTIIQIQIRDNRVAARVVPLPFYSRTR